MYTVKHAAGRAGLTPATLRAWERRYGIVQPERTGTGYRLYDEQAVRRLVAMAGLVSSGWSPSQAAAHILDAERTGRPGSEAAARSTSTTAPPAAVAQDVEDLVRAGRELDPDALAAVLDRVWASRSFESLADDWLTPCLEGVGSAWADGRISVAGEHFVSAALERRLAASFDAAGRGGAGPRAVVGLPAGARHTLGVLTFAVALRRAGADVTYLGADVPVAGWLDALSAAPTRVVAVSVPMAQDVPAAREAVGTIAAAAPEAVVVLGGAWADQVGGTTHVLPAGFGAAALETVALAGRA